MCQLVYWVEKMRLPKVLTWTCCVCGYDKNVYPMAGSQTTLKVSTKTYKMATVIRERMKAMKEGRMHNILDDESTSSLAVGEDKMMVLLVMIYFISIRTSFILTLLSHLFAHIHRLFFRICFIAWSHCSIAIHLFMSRNAINVLPSSFVRGRDPLQDPVVPPHTWVAQLAKPRGGGR